MHWKYTPLGPRDFPQAGILHPSALEIALGQSLGPRGAKSPPSGNLLGLGGCIFQYIPPLVSVRTQSPPALTPILILDSWFWSFSIPIWRRVHYSWTGRQFVSRSVFFAQISICITPWPSIYEFLKNTAAIFFWGSSCKVKRSILCLSFLAVHRQLNRWPCQSVTHSHTFWFWNTENDPWDLGLWNIYENCHLTHCLQCWQSEFMTVVITWQLRVTVQSLWCFRF